MQNLLPKMKDYLPWLKDADSQALNYACRQLDTAYSNFFAKKDGYPRYKSKRGRQSYTTTYGASIHIDYDNRKVKIPIVGWIRCRGLRKLPNDASIKRATISKESDGRYYIAVTYLCEINIDVKTPTTLNAIGLDYKVSGLYIDSNGDNGGKPKHYADSLELLQRRQRQLSHMIESHITGYKTVGNKRYPIYDRSLHDCKNIQKKRKQLSRLHKHIANERKDFLYKRSTAITKLYDVVCIEDISMREMLVDYANPNDEIEARVKEHNINRSVMDDGWYMFTQMLAYKADWQGKTLIKVERNYPSSEICSSCGYQKMMPLGVNTYECPHCGMSLNRDHNAAINIKNEGLRFLKAKAAA